MNKILLLLSAITLFACNGGETGSQERQNTVANQLTGEWNNISLKVDIHSKKRSNSDEVFSVKRGEWEQTLSIRPIRTFFRADSTWNSAHYTLRDSLFYNPSGKWWMEGDSLVMQQELPSPDLTKYLLQLKGDTASFTALLDWDSDGQKDDTYFGEQVKKK